MPGNKKLTATERIALYESALANIMKLAGECWDGRRRCSDPQHVARETLKAGNPKFFAEIYDEPYSLFYVDKAMGQFRRKSKRAKRPVSARSRNR